MFIMLIPPFYSCVHFCEYHLFTGLLNAIFARLHTDGAELIQRVLVMFDTKILSNNAVTKTQRIRLFNETTIPQILQCYLWKKSVKRETTKDKV